jgi:hypothetical protein
MHDIDSAGSLDKNRFTHFFLPLILVLNFAEGWTDNNSDRGLLKRIAAASEFGWRPPHGPECAGDAPCRRYK